MVICTDTSFLFSLYGNDVHSPRAGKWMKSQTHPLTLTSLNGFELENALRFAEFRGAIAPGEAGVFLAHFATDCAKGRVRIKTCNLADLVEEAKRLSATHTLTEGHRGFDILHVAGAIVLHGSHFLSFDENQKTLAKAEGLKVPL